MSARIRNKTVAAWLAVLLGSLGMHRFYLRGLGDWIGWLFPLPTALGWWGVDRVLTYGQDDKLSWLLIPLLGVSMTAACISAVIYTLSDKIKWNRQYNPQLDEEHTSGSTSWLGMGAVILAMLMGTISLMGSLAFGFQRYFEYQIEEARKISQ
jgi:TM2 domain-containing membrane protein YozV